MNEEKRKCWLKTLIFIIIRFSVFEIFNIKISNCEIVKKMYFRNFNRLCLILRKQYSTIALLRLNVSPIPVQIVESRGAASSYAVLKKFHGLVW